MGEKYVKMKWAALLALIMLLLLAACGACAEETAETTIDLVFDGKAYTDTVQVEWTEKYPVPEGGVKWDGTENFIGYVDMDDWKVIDADRFSYAEGQIAFMAQKGTDFYEVEQIAAQFNARVVMYIALTEDYVIELLSDKSFDKMQEVIEKLKVNEKIIASTVVPNYYDYLLINQIPDDPWNGATWDENTPDGANWGVEAIHAMSGWKYRDFMEEMNLGIIDNSFDAKHRDLEYVAVLDTRNDNGSHGTHVTGIALAKHNNNIGISGVFPKGKAIAVALEGGYWSTLKGVIGECLVRDARVINFSQSIDFEKMGKKYGYSGKLNYEQTVDVAQRYYNEEFADFNGYMSPYFDALAEIGKDFVFVQASGNDGINALFSSSYNWINNSYFKDRFVVVGAIDKGKQFINPNEERKWGSNWGTMVDIVAPGENIYSTVRGGGCDFASGTSMAAPHVTGVAAMIWSINPELTGPEVKQILTSNGRIITAETTGGTFRYPMLDAYACVQEAFANAKGNGQLNLQVFDKDTLKGVYDYNISIEPLEVCQEKEKTSVNGVKVSPYVKQLKLGKYRVVVSKEGYKPHTEIITVTRDSEINMNVTTIPTEAPEITKGRIEGTAVSNMTSTIHIEIDAIRNGQTITTLVSDYEGKFGAELETGTYSLVVKKDGITFANKEVVVFTGKVTDVQLELVNPTLKELPASDFTYEIVGGKYVKITGYIGATKTDFVFPSYIDGLPVREIGDYALYNRTDLRGRLVLPNTLLKIGNYAFGTDDFTDTYYTGELVIPPSVESIGKGAFRGAHWITGLTLSPKLQVITEKSFDGCFDIENDIVIPKSVKRIEKYALGGYPNAMNKKMIILGNLEYFDHTSLPGFEILEIQGNVPYYILNGLRVGGNWLTIIGHIGSDAERYAKAKGLTFIPIEKE